MYQHISIKQIAEIRGLGWVCFCKTHQTKIGRICKCGQTEMSVRVHFTLIVAGPLERGGIVEAGRRRNLEIFIYGLFLFETNVCL